MTISVRKDSMECHAKLQVFCIKSKPRYLIMVFLPPPTMLKYSWNILSEPRVSSAKFYLPFMMRNVCVKLI